MRGCGYSFLRISSPLNYLAFQNLYFLVECLMAHNREEFDKHSNDNNEILHIDRRNQNTSPV